MFRALKWLAWGGVAALALILITPDSAMARDRYWKNYWGWYDRDYSPYYRRHYYRSPYSSYRSYPRYEYYGRGPYRTYRYPYRYRHDGGSVRVGPFGIHWD